MHPTTILEENIVVYEKVTIGECCVLGVGSVIGRQPTSSKAVAADKSTQNFVEIGSRNVFCSNTTIYAGVKIGDDCLLGDNVSVLSNVEIGNKVLIGRNVTINSDVKIGDNTRIMDNTHITGFSQIGMNVFISVGVVSVNDNFFLKYGFNDDIKGVFLGDFVSVGPGCIFLPNCKIGKGCIISAGSVVKKDFLEEEVIIAGNPAAIVSRVPKYMKRY